MSSGLSLVNQQRNARAVLQGFGQCLLAAPVTGDNHWTNLIPYNGCVGQSPVETNHQLESRMRESRLSGSEGGAILISRPYPYPAPSPDCTKIMRPFSLGLHLKLTRMGGRRTELVWRISVRIQAGRVDGPAPPATVQLCIQIRPAAGLRGIFPQLYWLEGTPLGSAEIRPRLR